VGSPKDAFPDIQKLRTVSLVLSLCLLLSMYAPELHDIRNLSPDVLPHVYSTMIPRDCRSVFEAFWEEYSEKEWAMGYCACLLLWVFAISSRVSNP